jgi:transcriptional regulator with XRE-family HTH domain
MATARQRQLGSWLIKLRNQAECSVAEAAIHLGCSESKIRHLEAGRTKLKDDVLKELFKLYEVTDEGREQFDRVRRRVEQRGGWWSSYRLLEQFAPYVDFESVASEAMNFQLDLVPGLLQTERYAYEVHRAMRYTTNPQDIGRWVEARMERQKRLTSDPTLELRAVVGEAAFHRQVGGADAMREQIDQVLAWCEMPNVILQILPFAAGAHASPSSAFVVLSFDHPDDEDVAFVDTAIGGHTMDKRNDVAALRYVFDEVRSAALSSPDSLDLLRTIREDKHGA